MLKWSAAELHTEKFHRCPSWNGYQKAVGKLKLSVDNQACCVLAKILIYPLSILNSSTIYDEAWIKLFYKGFWLVHASTAYCLFQSFSSSAFDSCLQLLHGSPFFEFFIKNRSCALIWLILCATQHISCYLADSILFMLCSSPMEASSNTTTDDLRWI